MNYSFCRGQIKHWGAMFLQLTATVTEVAKQMKTRMWAIALRDSRPAKYRWRPLFNAAKSGWCPECRAVTLPRRETRLNLQGCPKLPNRSLLLVGQSSRYYEDMRRRYWRLTSSFPVVDTCLICEDTAQQICAMVPRWRFLTSFLRPVFPASRVRPFPLPVCITSSMQFM